MTFTTFPQNQLKSKKLTAKQIATYLKLAAEATNQQDPDKKREAWLAAWAYERKIMSK